MNLKSRKEKLKKINSKADQNILIKKLAKLENLSAEEYADRVIDELLNNIKIEGLED